MPRTTITCSQCGTECKTFRCRICFPLKVYTIVRDDIGFKMRKRLTAAQVQEYLKFGYNILEL